MDTITSLLLENRMFISEGREHDIIELSKKHNIPIVLGTAGNYKPGPYIERIYKSTDFQLTVEDFKTFIGELIPMADMYRGIRNFTFAELSIKLLMEKDGFAIETPTRVEVAVFMNTETDMYEMKSLLPEQEKIRKLKPFSIDRITREGYNLAKADMLIPMEPVPIAV